jgi:sugar lactone lactonase YvrE
MSSFPAWGDATEPMSDSYASLTDGGIEVDPERYARFDTRAGNPAMTPDGRLIVSNHPFPYGENPEYRVVEYVDDDTVRPFPNEAWSTPPGDDGVGIHSLIGLRADPDGIVRILDIGDIENGHLPKLVSWDTNVDRLRAVHHIPAHATTDLSFMQDFAYDAVRNAVYIADLGPGDEPGEAGKPALVALDLDTGRTRRVIEDHPSVLPEEGVRSVIEGDPVVEETDDGEFVPVKRGLDGITIDPAFEWVYFCGITTESVYRVRAANLLDESLTDAELDARIERYGDKEVCDGITVDTAGNVYITDMTNNAIGVTRPSGEYEIIARDDEKFLWPDGFCCGPDGHIYFTVTQLHRAPPYNRGIEDSYHPFELFRFESLAPVTVGR